jgi:hypothetical protein
VPTVKTFLIAAFVFAVVDGMAVAAVWWAFVVLGRNEYLTVLVLAAYTVSALAFTVSTSLILLGAVTARAVFDDRGTTIRPDRWVDVLQRLTAVAGFLAVAVFAICHYLGRIDIPLPPGNHQYIVMMATVAALGGAPSIWSMFARGGLSFQKLTPEGFELGQGLSSAHGEWADVVAISDRKPGKQPPVRATLFVKFSSGRIRTQAIDSYTPRGDALRRLVRYYWINPEARDELTDGRAVERLASYAA